MTFHRARQLLVVGVGNPICCDDRIGLLVCDVARARLEQLGALPVTFREACGSGMALLDDLEGFDDAIVVDAYHAADAEPGRVRVLHPGDFAPLGSNRFMPAHLVSLPLALAFAGQAGYRCPDRVTLLTVDVTDNCMTFGEELSAPVERSVPAAAERLVDLIMALVTEGANPSLDAMAGRDLEDSA